VNYHRGQTEELEPSMHRAFATEQQAHKEGTTMKTTRMNLMIATAFLASQLASLPRRRCRPRSPSPSASAAR